MCYLCNIFNIYMNRFETNDIYLASSLLTAGNEIQSIYSTKTEDKEVFTFVFNETQKVSDDISAHVVGKLLVSSRDLWDSFKAIKRRMYE